MRYECTRWGILIDEKYLSAREALDLFRWLGEQHENLLLVSQQRPPVFIEPRRLGEWSEEDERKMISEDEQIANF